MKQYAIVQEPYMTCKRHEGCMQDASMMHVRDIDDACKRPRGCMQERYKIHTRFIQYIYQDPPIFLVRCVSLSTSDPCKTSCKYHVYTFYNTCINLLKNLER